MAILKRMRVLKRHALIAAVLAAAVLSSACGSRNVRGPFRTQYLDSETKEPIRGVVFLAVWHTIVPNLVQAPNEPFYEAREVVSGPDGRAEIPRLSGPVFKLGLDVRFYEFAPGGYATERVQVTPTGGQRLVDPTVTFMRVTTRAERCKRLPYVAATLTLDAAERSPLFMEAVTRERSDLKCSELGRGQS